MLVVIAYYAKDKPSALRLARWIAEQGGASKHDCLLGVHQDTDTSEMWDVLKGAFGRLGSFLIDEEATVYPFIANRMWSRCAQYIADADEIRQPWLWMEPDAVPLTPDWLDRIEVEYKSSGKPFLLDKVVTPTSVHNSGVGVYPARVRDYTTQLWNLANIPWDVFFKEDFTPHTKHTALIHDKFFQSWDDPKSGPPVFPDAASLDMIEKEAVIFHRNKDGSLIDRLREKQGELDSGKAHNLAPVGAIPTPATFDDRSLLLARISELEAQLLAQSRRMADLQAMAGRKVRMKPKRTPEAQAAIDARMAKARAGRKVAA